MGGQAGPGRQGLLLFIYNSKMRSENWRENLSNITAGSGVVGSIVVHVRGPRPGQTTIFPLIENLP